MGTGMILKLDVGIGLGMGIRVPGTVRDGYKYLSPCSSLHHTLLASTYMQSFNFRSSVPPEISVCYSKSSSPTKLAEFHMPEPQLCWGTTKYNRNKYESNYWTRKAPACLLTHLCHYDKPRLCINIHHYAPRIGCSVTHQAATSLAAAGLCGVSEGSTSSFKSTTWNKLC